MAGERRALLISTAMYQDSAFRQLHSPVADVETLGAVLSDPAIGAYNVEILADSESYKVNQAIESFFATAKLDDQIVLYFSGHGFKDDNGRLYLITTDSRMRLLASTAISAQFIREQLDRCSSKRKIVILDCCYAGAFPDGMVRGDDTVDLLDKLSGRGTAVMTAASAIGYAIEGRGSPPITEINDVAPSIFTGALIDGLATGLADQDGDGLIGIGELYEYVYEKVRESAPQQMPGWRGNIEGNLYVATSPRGPRPTKLPAEISDAIQNTLPSVRLAIIDDLINLCARGHSGTVMAVYDALTQLADDDSRRVTAAARSALKLIDKRIQSSGIKVTTGPHILKVPEEVFEIAQRSVETPTGPGGEQFLLKCAVHMEKQDLPQLSTAIIRLNDVAKAGVSPDQRARYRELITKHRLFRHDEVLGSLEGKLRETLLRLAFDFPFSYEDYCLVEDGLGEAVTPDPALLQLIERAGTADNRVRALTYRQLPNVEAEKKLGTWYKSKDLSAEQLLSALAPEVKRPQHMRVLCDVTAEYLRKMNGHYDPNDIRRELRKHSYFSRKLQDRLTGQSQYQTNVLAVFLRAAYPDGITRWDLYHVMIGTQEPPTFPFLAAVLLMMKDPADAPLAQQLFVFVSCMAMNLTPDTSRELEKILLPPVQPVGPPEPAPPA